MDSVSGAGTNNLNPLRAAAILYLYALHTTFCPEDGANLSKVKHIFLYDDSGNIT